MEAEISTRQSYTPSPLHGFIVYIIWMSHDSSLVDVRHGPVMGIVMAAEEGGELFHEALALGALHPIWDPPTCARELEPAARSCNLVELVMVVLEGQVVALDGHVLLPKIIFQEGRQHGGPVAVDHHTRAIGQHGPSPSLVVAQELLDLLHDDVMVVSLPQLDLGEEHALEPGPEEPHHGEVLPAVAELLYCDRGNGPPHLLPLGALPDVYHLQRYLCRCGNLLSCGSELPDPLDVVPTIQEDVLSFANLCIEQDKISSVHANLD